MPFLFVACSCGVDICRKGPYVSSLCPRLGAFPSADARPPTLSLSLFLFLFVFVCLACLRWRQIPPSLPFPSLPFPLPSLEGPPPPSLTPWGPRGREGRREGGREGAVTKVRLGWIQNSRTHTGGRGRGRGRGGEERKRENEDLDRVGSRSKYKLSDT